MRLLYVCSDFGIRPSGVKGASIHLRAITRALADLGHDVGLLSPHGAPGGDHPAKSILSGDYLSAKGPARVMKNWLVDHGFADGVARELRSLLYNAEAVEQAVSAAATWQPDAIIERLSLFGYLGVDLAEALDVPLVVEINAPLSHEASTFRSLQLTSLARDIETRVLDRANQVIAVSAPLADLLVKQGIDPGKIHVVPNGVDLGAFQQTGSREHCRRLLGFKDEFVIGFVGSLKPWHGVDTLLHAFGKIVSKDPTARMLIVGTGPAETALRDSAARLGLGNSVEFAGAVDYERVPTYLRAMDVAAAPFQPMADFYFSPIKLFEYMAGGACIVASRLGQIEEVIHDRVHGLLCQPGDADDLAEKIEEARRLPELRATLSAQALERARNRYTWMHTARATVDVLSGILANQSTRSLSARACDASCDPAEMPT